MLINLSPQKEIKKGGKKEGKRKGRRGHRMGKQTDKKEVKWKRNKERMAGQYILSARNLHITHSFYQHSNPNLWLLSQSFSSWEKWCSRDSTCSPLKTVESNFQPSTVAPHETALNLRFYLRLSRVLFTMLWGNEVLVLSLEEPAAWSIDDWQSPSAIPLNPHCILEIWISCTVH